MEALHGQGLLHTSQAILLEKFCSYQLICDNRKAFHLKQFVMYGNLAYWNINSMNVW